MPQATDELREKIEARFGGIDVHGPRAFLKERGYVESEYIFSKPTNEHVIADDERECIEFLIHEWDFGFANIAI